jgi:hypothetical protein
MQSALNDLFHAIATDYQQWRSRTKYDSDTAYDEMLDNLNVEEGRKYIKVTSKQGSQTMVWGFIQKVDDKMFRAGDILKAAGWAAPARNKARGNILDGDFSWVRWTGPEYL